MNASLKRAVSAIVLTVAAISLAGCSLLESVVTGVPEGEQDVFTLKVGDCFNIPDENATEVGSLPVVDCAEPHDQEAFAATDMEGDVFPGDAAVTEALNTFCSGDVYTQFIGIPYQDSIYYTSGLTPTAGSWETGDRELLCTVLAEEGKTTGSLAGINQ
ncbi:septum formation family protein [Pseudolysinimonas sp.]|uniref:septum formation family protein n=1 Tax=Pseudolysinimonas sp. TaxID=2680009 RepID=UPI00286A7106|nr:septum formation family protein [Pseudolysinimonas sp.]